MNERIPVNPGEVEWAGDNPGIYLRDSVDGPWTGLGIFFHVVYSNYGRGQTMIVLGAPNESLGYPQANNICMTNNRPLTDYLIRDFISKFPSFKGQSGLDAMTRMDVESHVSEGDMMESWSETMTSQGVEMRMQWQQLGQPFAVEVTPETCATGEHDMYSVFLEAKQGGISVNGKDLTGKVTDRLFFGKQMSTAFLAISETWVKPAE